MYNAKGRCLDMLYIMRHGKTKWNEQRRLQGQTDIPLGDEGRRAAEEAAKKYADIPFDACYCSPLSRAEETARIFLGGRTPVICDARLAEMGFGIYEGCRADELPPRMQTLFESPQNYLPDGGAESLESLFLRTGEFMEEIALPLSNSGKSVLVVGHGAMNAAIICRIKGIPLCDFWQALTENTALVRLL